MLDSQCSLSCTFGLRCSIFCFLFSFLITQISISAQLSDLISRLEALKLASVATLHKILVVNLRYKGKNSRIWLSVSIYGQTYLYHRWQLSYRRHSSRQCKFHPNVPVNQTLISSFWHPKPSRWYPLNNSPIIYNLMTMKFDKQGQHDHGK